MGGRAILSLLYNKNKTVKLNFSRAQEIYLRQEISRVGPATLKKKAYLLAEPDI